MENTPTYTTAVQVPLDTISWEDDNYMEELLQVVQLFRPFSEAMTEFISVQGYTGNEDDPDAKAEFVRAAFMKAGMEPPREIREWFTGQPIRRETAFQICFAFRLDGGETDEFFRRVYARERSFNCHLVQEAVFYFCLNNGLTWADALEIQARVPTAGAENPNAVVVYTGSIMAEINRLETKEELVAWLNGNIGKFFGSNVTAYETIRKLWENAAGPDGLLLQERKELPSMLDDPATGRQAVIRAGKDGIKPWDACLAILQLDKKSVSRLRTDRSIKPILEKLHTDVQDSFPDRQGIDRILRGEHVSYERVRKWLVLLTFYVFWARKAIAGGNYAADSGDAERCFSMMNQHLMESGYPELYAGNPYDWIFLYAARSPEPLAVFRYIWNELLADVLDEHQ